MGFAHQEMAQAGRQPNDYGVLNLFDHLPRLVVLEIEWVDVLIFLRRILRILDGAVRPLTKPLRVRAYIRVVGGTLERDIERELDSVRFGSGQKPVKIIQRAQLRMDAGMAAFFRSDGPGASDLALPFPG